MKDIIENSINEGIKVDKLLVEGSESKYTVSVVSDEFISKSTIQRHKMISK